MLFHAGVPALKGGFLGVDIFFVISGFLISGRILDDLRRGRFSFRRFYDHRIRRILPTSVFVVGIVAIPAIAILSPTDLCDFARSVLANLAFASNVEFWRESGYFDAAAEGKPLLHTWTLAVEEQFYLLLPLILVALRRAPRVAVPIVLLGGAIVSFVVATRLSVTAPSASFYFLTTRGWELLVGGLAAWWQQRHGLLSDRMAGLCGAAGLCGIVASLFLIGSDLPHPSWPTLLPVGGTALLLLAAGREVGAVRILRSRPLVGLGLVSYAFYLWHQPLLALPTHVFVRDLSLPAKLGFVALALALAVATWRTVETFFRFRASRAAVYGFVLAGSAGLALTAVGLLLRDGELPFNHGFDQAPAHTEVLAPGGVPCQNRTSDRCRFTVPGAQTNVYLVGDSQAGVLLPQLLARQAALRFDVTDLSLSGCPFSSRYYRIGFPLCTKAIQTARFDELVRSPPGVVVIAAWLPGYLFSGSMFSEADNDCGLDILIVSDTFKCGMPGRVGDFGARFVADVGRLVAAGQKVVLVEPGPVLRYDANAFEAKKRFFPFAPDNRVSRADYDQRSAAVRDIYGRAKALYGDAVELVPVEDVLCGPAACNARIDGTLAYYDTNHLSPFGAKRVAGLLFARAARFFPGSP